MVQYGVNLILVSLVSTLLILLLVVLRPFFKKKYAMGLKQFLWIVLAVRLIVPVSFGNTFFNVKTLEYETGAKVYISQDMTKEEKEEIKQAYINLPEGITRREAIDDYMTTDLVSASRHGYSSDVVKIIEGKYTSKPVTVEEEGIKQWLQLGIIQGISFLDSHKNAIGLVYIIGVATFVVIHLLAMAYYGNRRRKMRKKVTDEAYLKMLTDCAKRIGVKRLPTLYQIEGLGSPMATGFFRFDIYIPMQSYTSKELHAVLTHELTHIFHQDLRIKMLHFLANALHWFNPMVYVMVKEAGRDMELFCDKSIVKMFQWEERQEYNEILLSVLRNHSMQGRQGYLTTCFKGGVAEMKERFLNNLDMTKKREGLIPVLVTGLVIVVSAGLFSIDAQAVEKAESSEFWATWTGTVTETEWDMAQPVEENYDLISSPIVFQIGSAGCEQVPIEKYDTDYVVPIHYNDFSGNVYVEKNLIDNDRKPWKEVPKIQIFCNDTQIMDYGVEVMDWQAGDIPDVSKNPPFFAEQCSKGEANPVFPVTRWEDAYNGDIRLYFQSDEVPDFVDVSDMVLNEDGTLRYDGQRQKVIYRGAYVDDSTGVATFSLAQHYSIEALEKLYAEDTMDKPFYRGYKIRCYWGSREGLQSAVYYVVLRTQTAEEGNAVN